MNFGAMEELTADVVVVGAGGAGLRVAYEAAAAGARTILITKGRIAVSGATAVGLASTAGFAVPDGAGDPLDNPDVHYNDIMTAAQGCADPALVRILVDEALEAAEDLDRWNIDFIREEATGKPLVAQGDFASRPRNRKIYHHGRPITVALKGETARLGVHSLEGTTVLSLLQDEKGVHGLVALTRQGQLIRVKAGATVLTTGGAGQLFKLSLMPPDITGDGYALGYRAGATLANMEFMQAGFGTVKPALNIVYTWFWGGVPPFVDREGRPVLDGALPAGTSTADAMLKKVEHYPFSASDASRWLEIATKNAMRDGRADETGSFFLDLRTTDPDKLTQKGFTQLWNVSKGWLRQKHMDIDAAPLRIGLFGHAINGGLVIDEHGQTSVEGLLSAGENAAGPYGADRLGGNMLLNCQVFGKRAGRRAAEIGRARAAANVERLAEAAVADLQAKTGGDGTLKIRQAHQRIKQTMTDHALVVRNEKGLKTAEAELAELAAALEAGQFGIETVKDVVAFTEAVNMIDVGRAMCAAAIERRETRGSHYREDADFRDDAKWSCPIMVRHVGNGAAKAEPGRFGGAK
ncbi:MAG TPA: FAD-binding protein [Mesorhizobium sp.]